MNYYEGDNLGSLSKIEVIEHYRLVGNAPLQLAPGAAWFEIPFKEESGKLNLKSIPSDNGRIYTYSGRFYFNRMRSEIDQAMGPYLNDTAVFRLTDMNGEVYIIGAPGSPATISENGDTGQKFVNENGTEFTFSIDQPYRALKA
jgi:hypothetical protein